MFFFFKNTGKEHIRNVRCQKKAKSLKFRHRWGWRIPWLWHGPDLQQNHLRQLQGEKKGKPQHSLHYQPITPDLTPASWSVDQGPACGPTTSPSAGLGGVPVFLCTPCTRMNLCKYPPWPSRFLCPLLIPH